MRPLFAALLAAAVLLGACGSENSGPSGSPVIGDISLARTGGIAGIDEEVTITADGEILLRRGLDGELQSTGEGLDPAELEALHDLVATAEFRALESDYADPNLCCDQFHYNVTAAVGGDTVTTATADGVEAPEILGQVLAILTPILDAN
jgi:hypothetical protein